MANEVNSTLAGSRIRSESAAVDTAEPASSSKNTRAHGGTSGLPTETHEEGGQYILRYNMVPDDTGIFYLVRHFLGMSFVLLIENLSYSSEGEKLTKIVAGVKDNTMKYLRDVYKKGVNDDGKIAVPVTMEGCSRPNTYEVVRIVHLAHRQENLFEKIGKKCRIFDMSQLYALLRRSGMRRYCRSEEGTFCESSNSGPESLLDSIAEGTIYLINYCLQTMPQDRKQKSNHNIRRPALCIKKLDNDEALFLPIATFGRKDLQEVFKGELDYANRYYIPIIPPGGGGECGGGSGLPIAMHKPVNIYPQRSECGMEIYTEGYVYALEVKEKVAKVKKLNGVPSKIHEDDLLRVQKIVSENICEEFCERYTTGGSGGRGGSRRQSGGGSGSQPGGGNGSPSGGGSASMSGGGSARPSRGGSASQSGGGSASQSGGGSGGGGGGGGGDDGNRGRSGHESSNASGNGSGSKRKRKSESIDDHEATPEKLPAHDEGGSSQCGRNEAHLENTLGEKYSYPRVCELMEDLSEMDPWDGCGTWPLNIEEMMTGSPVDEQEELSVIGSPVDKQQKLDHHYIAHKNNYITRAIWPTVTNESIFKSNNEFDQLQETKDVGLMNLLLTINKLEEEGKSPTIYDVNVALMKQGKIPWALTEDSLVECIESVECLNEDVNHKFVNALKEVNWNNDHLYLESGQDDKSDAELLLNICFMTRVKVTHLIINGPLEKGPKILKLFVNHSNMHLPYDTEVAVQTIELENPKHLQGEPIALNVHKFKFVDSLQVLAQGQEGVPGKTLQITKFALIGSAFETTDVSRIKRQCSRPYAMTQFGDNIW